MLLLSQVVAVLDLGTLMPKSYLFSRPMMNTLYQDISTPISTPEVKGPPMCTPVPAGLGNQTKHCG